MDSGLRLLRSGLRPFARNDESLEVKSVTIHHSAFGISLILQFAQNDVPHLADPLRFGFLYSSLFTTHRSSFRQSPFASFTI
jgi:hypothetical protein